MRWLDGEREFELAALALARELEESGEAETGRGAAKRLAIITDRLIKNSGLDNRVDQQRAVRVNSKQLDAQGRAVNATLNKVDTSFVYDDGPTQRRVNIEIDTQLPRSHGHETVVNRDRHATNVYLMVDPWSGKVIGARVRRAGSDETVPLSRGDLNQILSRKPALVRAPARRATARVRPSSPVVRPQARKATARPAVGRRVRLLRELGL